MTVQGDFMMLTHFSRDRIRIQNRLFRSQPRSRIGPGDPILAEAAAARVAELLDSGEVVDQDDKSGSLTATDVAVITPHVEQSSAVAARLCEYPGVLIGTANRPKDWNAKQSW
jgi:hypothetical protein